MIDNKINNEEFDFTKAIRPKGMMQSNTKKLPKMRTIDEAFDFVLSKDNNTCVTRYLIRELCKKKKVHHIKTGNKYLVDLEDLIFTLSTSLTV